MDELGKLRERISELAPRAHMLSNALKHICETVESAGLGDILWMLQYAAESLSDELIDLEAQKGENQ